MVGNDCNQIGLIQTCFDRRTTLWTDQVDTRVVEPSIVEQTERAILAHIKDIVFGGRTISPEAESTTTTFQNGHLHFIGEVAEVGVLSKTGTEIVWIGLINMIRSSDKLAKAWPSPSLPQSWTAAGWGG
jgi:hypothetical protein